MKNSVIIYAHHVSFQTKKETGLDSTDFHCIPKTNNNNNIFVFYSNSCT